jgi:shikimate 5-dehydrogenase
MNHKDKIMAKFALIGKNIGYSKSKEIFNKTHHHQYDVFDIDEDKIPETLAYLQKNNYVGVNVTKP